MHSSAGGAALANVTLRKGWGGQSTEETTTAIRADPRYTAERERMTAEAERMKEVTKRS